MEVTLPGQPEDGVYVNVEERAPSPRIFWKVAFGVLFGNLMTGIVAGIVYFLMIR